MIESIITYDDIQEMTIDCYAFVLVTFKKDFGPWKVGQIVDTLNFDYEHGNCEEWSNDGKLIRSCKIGLVVLDD